MKFNGIKHNVTKTLSLAPARAAAGLVTMALILTAGLAAHAEDQRAPEVPDSIAAGTTNKVHFHGFGVGVQIYTWDGSSWGRPVPEAILFNGQRGVVVIHSAGPTWESNSGSKVVGAVAAPPVTVDTNAIPWLLLSAVKTEGPGIFANTTFIQRVNTTGGLAPTANGTFVGQVARVPYTADYFFFRASND